ncbi:hypothetical protein D0Y65_037595 [Glycine soja]|uniref:Uncharacterized protein n=1 Tax=Glycine soja TaxID=3848 RepID=A0A445H1H5_GLYSO|nr:hypothetical protein D0Y65_037595 [Glycine soja]
MDTEADLRQPWIHWIHLLLKPNLKAWVKHGELLFGRNKLLSLIVGKSQTSRTRDHIAHAVSVGSIDMGLVFGRGINEVHSHVTGFCDSDFAGDLDCRRSLTSYVFMLGGSKKQITKILKYVLRLYSSFSKEIVSVLLEYLLKALSSSELEENADDASIGLTTQNVLADWMLVILKLCNKEPELLLNLLKEVLDMIESQEDMKYKEDNPNMGVSHSRTEFRLSSLFAWLVGILSKVPSAAANMPKRVLHELLRRCLLVSQLCNKQLVDSALQLAELMNDSYLMEKVRKFSLISLSNLESADDESPLLTSKNIFQFEESMLEAAKKLELVKQQIMKNKKPMAMDCDTEKSQTWTLAKSWNPCPIGMLPRAVGSSGCLPVLNIIDDEKQNQVSSCCLPAADIIVDEKQNQVSEKEENWKLIPHGSKRDASLDLLQLDNSTVKKMRETKEFSELNNELPLQGGKGCLMVGGVRKKLTEEELLVIESSVSIIV